MRFLTRTYQQFSVVTRSRRQITYDVASPDEFAEKVLKSKVPVIIDFHASWCGPCKQLAPLLTKTVGLYGGKIDLAKVDVDEHEDIAMEYGVMAVPTVLALKGGEVVEQFSGMKTEDELNDIMKKMIT